MLAERKTVMGLQAEDAGKVAGGKLKWYFLLCFVAGAIITMLLLSVIAFGLATHKLTARAFLAISLQIALFLWATREMYRSYREES